MKKLSLFLKLSLLIVTGTLFLASNAVLAEDIKIPVGSQSPELEQVARPKMGVSKTSVQAQFGEPIKQNAAKGNPPISSWEYADFIVYFENDHVIHSVLKPKYHESKETVIETTDEMSEDDLKLKPKENKDPQ